MEVGSFFVGNNHLAVNSNSMNNKSLIRDETHESVVIFQKIILLSVMTAPSADTKTFILQLNFQSVNFIYSISPLIT